MVGFVGFQAYLDNKLVKTTKLLIFNIGGFKEISTNILLKIRIFIKVLKILIKYFFLNMGALLIKHK